MKPEEIFVSDDIRVIVVGNHFVVFPFNNKICSLSIYIIAILISSYVYHASGASGNGTRRVTLLPAWVGEQRRQPQVGVHEWQAGCISSEL
jgi:hypothetical protein